MKNQATDHEIYFLMETIALKMKNNYRQIVNVIYDIFQPLDHVRFH